MWSAECAPLSRSVSVPQRSSFLSCESETKGSHKNDVINLEKWQSQQRLRPHNKKQMRGMLRRDAHMRTEKNEVCKM